MLKTLIDVVLPVVMESHLERTLHILWFLENDPLPSSARECGLCLSWLFLQAILIASMALYKWSSSGSGILCCATQCYAPAEQPTAGWKWAGPLGSGLKRPPGRTLLDLHFFLMVRLLLPPWGLYVKAPLRHSKNSG
uniref:Uncharacterized protein n=1 Tax=Vicia faba TaxID=3906 RepID=R4IUA3_VICFA|nr:hypothetical protein [Vicia faba]AGC78931.1 hypothetical protein [Vicia faba]